MRNDVIYLKHMHLHKVARTNIHIEYRGDLQKLAFITGRLPPAEQTKGARVETESGHSGRTLREKNGHLVILPSISPTHQLCATGADSPHFTVDNAKDQVISRGVQLEPNSIAPIS